MELLIERIGDKHFDIIGDFECDVEDKPMETFLKCEALRCDESGEGNTFIVLDKHNTLIGYYTIKCNAMQLEDNGISNVYPAAEISRLAVDMNYQKNGYGSAIFRHILETIYNLKEEIGIKYVMLFSVPSAIGFYKKFKFLNFPSSVNVLPSWDIDKKCQGMYAVLE